MRVGEVAYLCPDRYSSSKDLGAPWSARPLPSEDHQNFCQVQQHNTSSIKDRLVSDHDLRALEYVRSHQFVRKP